MEILLLFAILFLLMSSAFFSSSETALFSLSPTKVSLWKGSKNPPEKRVFYLLSHPQDLLVTVFMWNTVVNVLLQNGISDFIGEAGSWWLKVFSPFILLLIFGEIIPKQIGMERNQEIALNSSYLVLKCQQIIRPIRALFVVVTRYLSKSIFFFLKKEPPLSKEEVEFALKKSGEIGIVGKDEMFLALRYFSLQDTYVKSLMHSKDEIPLFFRDSTFAHLNTLFSEKKKSVVFFTEEGVDKICGYLSLETYFSQREKVSSLKELEAFLKPPLFIPENISSRRLLKQMEEKKEEVALVVGEFGDTSGFIEKKDLYGFILDPFTETGKDTNGNSDIVISFSPTSAIVQAKIPLSKVESWLKISFEKPPHVVSLGGWLINELDTIPPIGTEYENADLYLKVISADPQRINKLLVVKKHKEP